MKPYEEANLQGDFQLACETATTIEHIAEAWDEIVLPHLSALSAEAVDWLNGKRAAAIAELSVE